MTEKYEIKQGSSFEKDDWWTWWVWIEGSENDLDKIESVVYILHSTFKDPVRTNTNRSEKFMLKTSGWGVFTLYAKIILKDGKHIKLSHDLKLYYPSGEENME